MSGRSPLQPPVARPPRRGTPVFSVAALPAWALPIFALLVLGGCAALGGGSGKENFNVDQGEIATRALPSTREVPHASDSLAHLKIVEKNGRLDFELSESYRKMLTEWSTGRTGQRAGTYFRTHATLWSKELSLASLIPEKGVQMLSKSLARDMIDDRIAEYDSTVQIDVYIFAPSVRRLDLSDLQLDTAGRHVELRDEDGTTYEPLRIDSNAPLDAYYAGHQTLYGRNAVFFDRYTEDGTDLLDAEQLRLYVRPAHYYFTWVFPANR